MEPGEKGWVMSRPISQENGKYKDKGRECGSVGRERKLEGTSNNFTESIYTG